MRTVLTAMILSLAAVAAAPASAAPWSDPASHMTFTAPDGWTITQPTMEGFTYVVASNADRQCHVIGSPHPETAAVTADRIRAAGRVPIAADAWAGLPASVPTVFPDSGAQLVHNTVDDSSFWPVQRAEFNAQGHVIHAAIEFRPGLEIWAFCWSTGAADDAAGFDAVLHTVGLSNDAELQAAAERAERAARMRSAQNNAAHGSVMRTDNDAIIESMTPPASH